MPASISDEFRDLKLPDTRLEKRVVAVAEGLAAKPQSSIAATFETYGEAKAAYRLFGNGRVDAAAILAPHRKCTIDRMMGRKVVLCVEDTTFVSFGGRREDSGLGAHTHGHEKGFSAHVMLAVAAEDGCPLGVLGSQTWVKDPALGRKASRKKRPIQERESFRWVEGVGKVAQLAEELSGQPDAPSLVYVADRESDVYETMERAQGTAAHFLIRANHDRICADGRTMGAHLAASQVLGVHTVRIGAREGNPSREAKLEVRALPVRLRTPAGKAPGMPEFLDVQLVEARESDPPEGIDPVHWILVGDLPVGDFAQAVEKLEWYAKRWTVEIFFKTLKSGCGVEAMQLQNYTALTVAASLYMVVAWRILHLVHMGRTVPDLPCECLFAPLEWRAAWIVSKRSAPPQNPPSLSTIIHIVAKLGGYPGRRNDPPPGAKAIWNGLTRVHDFALTLDAVRQTQPL